MSKTSTNNGSSREIISDDYRGMRLRYGVDEVPGRQMGKFSPICEDKKPQFFSMRTQGDARGSKGSQVAPHQFPGLATSCVLIEIDIFQIIWI